MIIKNDKGKQESLFMSISIVLFSAMCLLDGTLDQGDAGLLLFGFLFGILLMFPALIKYRELILDEYGCTFKLFKYERTYSWDELKVKKIIRNKDREWAFFSVKNVNKPAWIEPFEYCAFRHPLTCFYVTLKPQDYKIPKRPLKSVYAASLVKGVKVDKRYLVPDSMYDKTKFLLKLEEWGIELETDETK